MSIVRAFSARVVRQDWAQRVVTAMSDSAEQARTDPDGLATDPAAYDESAGALYVYRQRRDDVSHTGLVCEVAIEAFVDRRVRGHEAVDAHRVEALARHHAKATSPPTLVSLLHRPGAAFTRLLAETCRTAPILDFEGPSLQQTVWRVAASPATDTVTEELASAVHYVADGHHRVAAALAQSRLAGRPAHSGLLCVVHPMDGLSLAAFHRRLAGPVDRADLLGMLDTGFEVKELPGPPAPEVGSFGLYVAGGWFDVRHRGGRSDGPAGLDVAVLQGLVLDRLTPGPSQPVETAPARTPIDELTQRCDADGGALFMLAPPTLAALTLLADAGQVMPPKTTYFEPKPCIGIFLRPGRRPGR